MHSFRRTVCTLAALALLAGPLTQANAQSAGQATGTNEPAKREGPSPAAVAVGAVVGLALLAALFGGSSSSSSSSSRRDSDSRASDMASQRQWDREAAQRAAADRLTRPNSLGW